LNAILSGAKVVNLPLIIGKVGKGKKEKPSAGKTKGFSLKSGFDY
jgi:hypothetical protein